uniref:Uncharacterized protein n=1 Tax=Arundo donax TaxID=35708 RepID=A0A0A9AXL3_ARUDO
MHAIAMPPFSLSSKSSVSE